MYLIDSDVFINAKNRHYAFDVVPGFWSWLERAHLAGRVFTVEEVASEVRAGADELADWMKVQPTSFALKPGANDAAAMARVSQWADESPYSQGAVATFLAVGDYFLVAQALSLGYTVVTHEVPAPNSIRQIKIPDACRALQIPWMSPFRMLRDEGARFVL